MEQTLVNGDDGYRGFFTDISTILRDHAGSIEVILQRRWTLGTVVTTHDETTEAAMVTSLTRINDLAACAEPQQVIHIKLF